MGDQLRLGRARHGPHDIRGRPRFARCEPGVGGCRDRLVSHPAAVLIDQAAVGESCPILNAGDAVTAEQMRALFGAGMHPLAAQRLEQLAAADLADTSIKTATRVGWPFKVYAGDVSSFRLATGSPGAPQTHSCRHSRKG